MDSPRFLGRGGDFVKLNDMFDIHWTQADYFDGGSFPAILLGNIQSLRTRN